MEALQVQENIIDPLVKYWVNSNSCLCYHSEAMFVIYPKQLQIKVPSTNIFMTLLARNFCKGLLFGFVGSFGHPENLSQSRWVKIASIILRLYVGIESPSSERICLFQFIVRVYVLVCFSIKYNSSFKLELTTFSDYKIIQMSES